jgi:hypothetical protein
LQQSPIGRERELQPGMQVMIKPFTMEELARNISTLLAQEMASFHQA